MKGSGSPFLGVTATKCYVHAPCYCVAACSVLSTAVPLYSHFVPSFGRPPVSSERRTSKATKREPTAARTRKTVYTAPTMLDAAALLSTNAVVLLACGLLSCCKSNDREMSNVKCTRITFKICRYEKMDQSEEDSERTHMCTEACWFLVHHSLQNLPQALLLAAAATTQHCCLWTAVDCCRW